MSAKHTPGPWKIDFGYNRIIKSIGPCVPDQYAGSAWLDVAESDAHLMSAAPIMLQALKEAVPHLEYMAGGMTHAGWKTKEAQEFLERVLAVIAEAEGAD